jgi:hypothetical protein
MNEPQLVMQPGWYKISYSGPAFSFEGIGRFSNGKIVGVDMGFVFEGTYTFEAGVLKGSVRARMHTPGNQSILGPLTDYYLELVATFSPDMRQFGGTATVRTLEHLKMNVTGTWVLGDYEQRNYPD